MNFQHFAAGTSDGLMDESTGREVQETRKDCRMEITNSGQKVMIGILGDSVSEVLNIKRGTLRMRLISGAV